MPDITLVNLNMLFIRYGDDIERELHVPLGCLYLTRAMENAGLDVDFRDYQLCPSDDPFDMNVFLEFLADPAPVIGLSCMANLLPFTIMAAKAIRERWPDRTIVLGGVGSKSVEQQILERFPWIDVICRGEGELTGPELMRAIRSSPLYQGRGGGGEGAKYGSANPSPRHSPSGRGSNGLLSVPGISFRDSNGQIIHNPDRERIRDLDSIGFPAWEKIDLPRYAGYGMMTSRGCPYPCTFCSVAPVWNLESYSRSPANIVAEMVELNERAGVDLFLFQDEFFVSGKRQVMDFCRLLKATGRKLEWKAFGRVNLIDEEMMRAMADAGCLELRFGIESGSDRVLSRIRKGFTAAEALELIPKAIPLFPRVDVFYVWGFPFETLEDFNQSLFQMVSFRMMGARILPSLLSLLPQTRVYRECVLDLESEDDTAKRGRGDAEMKAPGVSAISPRPRVAAPPRPLEFCPWLLPEFVFTGHEVTRSGSVEIPERHRKYFELIRANPDIFPGFFHIDLAGNVLPKLRLLQQFGFYPRPEGDAESAPPDPESCGAHSPRVAPPDLATRATL